MKSDKQNKWDEKLKLIQDYIDTNQKKPSLGDTNETVVEMSRWLQNQEVYYNTNKKMMKYVPNRIKWEQFIENNKTIFMSYEEDWNNSMKELEEYISQQV